MTESQAPDPQDKHAVVHLVHGTWARNADWIKADSELAVRIVEALGPDTVVAPFKWTGRNAHSARLNAGNALGARLEDYRIRYPSSPQFIIAHSHGGNVAAYALRDDKTSQGIEGVICLGTPFIRATKRDLIGSQRLVQWLLLACLAIIAALTVAAVIHSSSYFLSAESFGELDLGDMQLSPHMLDSPFLPYYFASASLVLAAGLGWVFSKPFVWLWRFARTRGFQQLARSQEEIVAKLEARFAGVPVFTIGARGDEAAWGLALVSRLAQLPYRLWRPSRFLLYGIAAWAVLLWFSLWTEIGGVTVSPLLMLLAPLIWFVLATGFVAVAGWLACLIWPAIFRSHALGFGRDDFSKNFLVEVRASPSPERSALTETTLVPTTGKGLRHSRLYTSENVLELIVEWIGKRLPKSSQSPGQAS